MISKVTERIIDGDVRTASRLIRDIDDEIPAAREMLKELQAFTGNAYVIGITGSPGVGKSTLIDQMIRCYRKMEKTVGIIVIDPTSPFNGGAILGDRVRMQQHATDSGVFIRSMATRGCFGGLTQSTRGTVDVLDAMGKEIIIIETVGVGQDEIDIVKTAQTTVVVVIPGMGDNIQAMKAGILEAGDIFVINKASREGTEKTYSDIKTMIAMDQRRMKEGRWTPLILKTEATRGKGINTLIEEIGNHNKFIKNSNVDILVSIKREKARDFLAELVKNRLFQDVIKGLTECGEFENAVNAIAEGKLDPYSACDMLIQLKVNQQGKYLNEDQ